MKTLLCFLLISFTAALAQTVNFDDLAAGTAPVGWTAAVTGEGNTRWTIEKDATAPSPPNVFKQSAEGAYPISWRNGTSLKDGFVEVKFKLVAGKEDQAGGIIWRAQDKDNYYIARANALEGNVRIYHFVKGKRTQFKGTNLEVASDQWHTLRVEFSGNTFKVIFNGKQLFEAQDSTIKDAGKVGLWTKADSVTLFDDFSYGAK